MERCVHHKFSKCFTSPQDHPVRSMTVMDMPRLALSDSCQFNSFKFSLRVCVHVFLQSTALWVALKVAHKAIANAAKGMKMTSIPKVLASFWLWDRTGRLSKREILQIYHEIKSSMPWPRNQPPPTLFTQGKQVASIRLIAFSWQVQWCRYYFGRFSKIVPSMYSMLALVYLFVLPAIRSSVISDDAR